MLSFQFTLMIEFYVIITVNSVVADGAKLGWRVASSSYHVESESICQESLFSLFSSHVSCNRQGVQALGYKQQTCRSYKRDQPHPNTTFTLLASTFSLATSPKPQLKQLFPLYEFFSAGRAASALISSVLVCSMSSNVDRPKVDDASLLPLFIALKVIEHVRSIQRGLAIHQFIEPVRSVRRGLACSPIYRQKLSICQVN